VLVAAIPCVPAEEAVAARRNVGRQIMLGKIDVVVCGDQRDARPLALRGPIHALAWMSADFRAWRGGGRQTDELRIALCGELCVLGARGRDRIRGRLCDALLRACLAAEAEREGRAADQRRTPVHAGHGSSVILVPSRPA